MRVSSVARAGSRDRRGQNRAGPTSPHGQKRPPTFSFCEGASAHGLSVRSCARVRFARLRRTLPDSAARAPSLAIPAARASEAALPRGRGSRSVPALTGAAATRHSVKQPHAARGSRTGQKGESKALLPQRTSASGCVWEDTRN